MRHDPLQAKIDNMQAILPADIIPAKTERDGHAPALYQKRAVCNRVKLSSKDEIFDTADFSKMSVIRCGLFMVV